MAGNDELYYLIKFTVDDQTYEDAKRKIGELHEAKGGGAKAGEEATEGEREFAEALRETTEATEELMDRLIELRQAQDEQRAVLKAYKDAQKEGVELDKQQRQSQVETEAALKNTSSEYRAAQAALIANTEAAEGALPTYNQISAENRNIAQAMRDIPFDDNTGQLEELKKQWAENNTILKEFDAELGDHRRNVGNYNEAISTAASGIAAFQGPLGPVAGRLNALNTTIQRSIPLLKGKATGWRLVARAMIATGIGALLVALGTLIAMLSRLQPVMDALARTGRVLGAAFDNLTDAVGAFFGMNERSNLSMGDSIRLARELHQAQIDLEEQQIRNIVTNAELEASIARLRMEAEDEANSHRDRIGAMEQAMDLTRENIALKEAEAEQALWIAEQNARIAVNDREANEELAEAEAALIRVRHQKFTQMRQLVRRRQSIINQLRVEEERRRRNIQSIIDERDAAIDSARKRADAALLTAQREAEERGIQARIDVLRESGKEQQAIALETQREITRIEREFNQERLNIEKEFNEASAADAKLLRMQNLSEEQAMQRARVETAERFGQELAGAERELQQTIIDQNARFDRERRNLQIEIMNRGTSERLAFNQAMAQINVRHAEERKDLERAVADHGSRMRQEENRRARELMAQNLNDQQAYEQARLNLAEQFKAKRLRLLQAEWQTYLSIQEEQAAQAAAMTIAGFQEENNAIAEHFESITMMELQQTQRRLAIQQTGTDELVRLEQERGQRQNELRQHYIEQGIDAVEAAEMASYRARLEFAEQFAQTQKGIEDALMQYRIEKMEAYSDLAAGVLGTMFGDHKAARVATAIVDTYVAANRALASADPPLSMIRAAAAITMGMANVRSIMDTNIGSTPSGGGASMAATSHPRGFEVVERDSVMAEGAVARQVAESASSSSGELNPTFEFHGDLDNEVMAIKVRQGNRMIDTKTLTTKSRN